MRAKLLLPVLMLAAVVPAAAQTQRPAARFNAEPSAAEQYKRCLARAEREPLDAFEDALAWRDRDRGGGDAAKHCAAVAMLNLGRPAVAAERLEQLAQEMRARPPGLRAEMLGQAGQAWLDARQPEHAYAVLTAAIDLAPRDVELWIDRAQALAAKANYWEAIDDLNRAIDLDPRRADAFVFRAVSYRYVDSLELAADDIERAAALAPQLPEVWLERGILDRLRGDAAAARRNWLQVLVLDPDGPAGDAARSNIELLELKLDDKPAPLERRKR
jgi:tetratricopeptide (TPR) repeat protein